MATITYGVMAKEDGRLVTYCNTEAEARRYESVDPALFKAVEIVTVTEYVEL